MTDTMKLIPAEGRVVPQEDGTPWPSKDGKPLAHEVPVTRYIRRRLADRDLIKAGASAAPAAHNAAEPAVTDNADTSTRRKK